MSIAVIRATLECDGCSKQFRVDIDPAWKAKPGIFDSVADFVDEALLNGFTSDGGFCSLQHDLQLCSACTKIADDVGPEDQTATREEIVAALDEQVPA